MIDSHCHLDLFDPLERKIILEESQKLGIDTILIPGILPSQLPFIEQIILQNHSEVKIFGSLGLHPWFQEEHFLKTTLPSNHLPEIIAIGEVGFDKKNPNLKLQEEIFRFAIHLADSHKKILIIHLVHYPEVALRILKEENPASPFILHSWSKNMEITKSFIPLPNAHFSFSGNLLTSPKLHNVFKSLPLERILLETDAPDQFFPGAQFERGKDRNNSPLNIRQIYDFSQTLLPHVNLTFQIAKNFQKLLHYCYSKN